MISCSFSAARPYFAPYTGFFLLAGLCDVFVILDNVQFPQGTTDFISDLSALDLLFNCGPKGRDILANANRQIG